MQSIRWLPFLSLLIAVDAACLPGWIPFPNDDPKCLFLSDKPDKELGSKYNLCWPLAGQGVKIENAFENAFIWEQLQKSNKSAAAWIGINDAGLNQWVYDDGTPLTYKNWASGQPFVYNWWHVVAEMDPRSGKWVAADVNVARPFFCSAYAIVQGGCEDGWRYLNDTGFCYQLQNFTSDAGNGWKLYDFPTAESICHAQGAHLVSIHSDKENQFVQEMITTSAAKSQYPCDSQWAWVGYTGDGRNKKGTWTDGSPVDWFEPFNHDPQQHKTTGNWVISNDDSCLSEGHAWTLVGGFGSRTDELTSRFVCKMAPKRKSDRKAK